MSGKKPAIGRVDVATPSVMSMLSASPMPPDSATSTIHSVLSPPGGGGGSQAPTNSVRDLNKSGLFSYSPSTAGSETDTTTNRQSDAAMRTPPKNTTGKNTTSNVNVAPLVNKYRETRSGSMDNSFIRKRSGSVEAGAPTDTTTGGGGGAPASARYRSGSIERYRSSSIERYRAGSVENDRNPLATRGYRSGSTERYRSGSVEGANRMYRAGSVGQDGRYRGSTKTVMSPVDSKSTAPPPTNTYLSYFYTLLKLIALALLVQFLYEWSQPSPAPDAHYYDLLSQGLGGGKGGDRGGFSGSLRVINSNTNQPRRGGHAPRQAYSPPQYDRRGQYIHEPYHDPALSPISRVLDGVGEAYGHFVRGLRIADASIRHNNDYF